MNFDINEYRKEYNKKNYINKSFRVKPDEAKLIDEALKKVNQSLRQFVLEKVKKTLKK